MTKQAKYRPVLTATQITHILTLAKTEQPLTEQSLSIISTLSPFLAKIQNAGITPAYIPDSKPSVYSLESLGGENHSLSPVPKEVYWEECYKKYNLTPELCSINEIEAANEHMYLNELMSPEEAKLFEEKSNG